MIAAVVWGGLLGLLAVGLLLTVMYIGTPERQAAPGRHQRPTRRQRERADDEAYLRQVQEVRAEQHMEAGPVTASGMALPGPLMPLPPEVDPLDSEGGWHDDLYAEPEPEPTPETARALDVITDAYREGIHRMLAEPVDPHDVASGEQEADAYVGPPQPGDPYLEHLASRQYADSTGTFAAIAGGE